VSRQRLLFTSIALGFEEPQVNAHRLDPVFSLADGGRLNVDVKTKLLDRASAPKDYNIVG